MGIKGDDERQGLPIWFVDKRSYYLGQVLNKKYRYLRLCYLVFMYGMIVSVAIFSIAITMNH